MRWRILALALASCKGAAPVPASTDAVASSAPAIVSAAPMIEAGTLHSAMTIYDFDHDATGSAPAGFTSGRTGQGREGKWLVQAEAGRSNVVAQTDADPTDNRFAVLWANEPVLDDVVVAVNCKPVSGKVDQACGLVCRLQDADNYYLARANALEGNVRFYAVEGGKRRQLASWSGAVKSGEWHPFRFTCQSNLFTLFWDAERVIQMQDKTFTRAGKVGLWTKADSVTWFDDLTAVRPVL